MIELPPLAPCPFGKKRRHEITAILPGDDDHDVTIYCCICGILRKFPASGPMLDSPPGMESIPTIKDIRGWRE